MKVLVFLLVFAVPAYAQSAKEAKHKSGTTKMWVGLGLVGLGGLMAANSRTSVEGSVPGTNITATASQTSTGQLVAGIIIAGGGAYLLWNGLQERSEADAMPSTRFFVSTAPRAVGAFLRHTW